MSEYGELREMQRLATGPDGLVRLLGGLGRRFNGHAALVAHASDDRLKALAGELDALNDSEVATGIESVLAGHRGSVSIDTADANIRVLAIESGAPSPALVLSGRLSPAADSAAVIADAATLLGLRWQLDQAESRERRVRRAEERTREAVLHMLMARDADTARHIAGALGPPLPDKVRVYLVEGTPGARNDLAAQIESECRSDVWPIKCPVYRRHLILLAPVAHVGDDADDVEHALRNLQGDMVIGAGSGVALVDTGQSYEQAYHALAVARHRTERYSRFNRSTELVTVLDARAFGWAHQKLDRLLGYVPQRPQDPDRRELLATLSAWLDFRGSATGKLKIHRNTLAARLGLIAAILDEDLDRLATQAELHLALRLYRGGVGERPGQPTHLSELLAGSATRHWANLLLTPLLHERKQAVLSTVQAWLAADAHIGPAAQALGVTTACVRKRLMRAEQALGRSLLGGPSARFDLYLALRLRDHA